MNVSRGKIISMAWPLCGAISLLALWWLVILVFEVEEYIAPTPLGVLQAVQADFSLLMWNLLPTMFEAISGFLLGNGLAILVAVAFVHSMTLERMYFPIAVLFNTIPTIALAPILIHVLGLGMAPKIAIATIICFFPTLVNMIRGFRSCSANELELMRVLAASRSEIFSALGIIGVGVKYFYFTPTPIIQPNQIEDSPCSYHPRKCYRVTLRFLYPC